MDKSKLISLTELAMQAAIEAGERILKVYDRIIEVDRKADGSPLTEADRESHDLIIEKLEPTGFPIMSEEGSEIPYEERQNWNHYWLVDPLDGTKEFIKRNGEFTVNIAFMEDNRPVSGVILQPVTGILVAGIEGVGVYKYSRKDNPEITDKRKLQYVESHEGILRVIASRTHASPETDTFINDLKHKTDAIELLNAGSSLKFCMLAEGMADLYPRFAPTMEWDTAAGHAILKSTGKNIYVYPSGNEMRYNKPKLINDWFIAR